VVPKKEGVVRSVASISDIWRGPGHPRKLHLLDNDFFGQPAWRARMQEIREGAFKVCWNQGINIRLMDDEIAGAISSVEYRDDAFRERRIYTAWDSIGDEKAFFHGIDCLERAGVPGKHVRAYMLIGYARGETMERIHYRIQRMVERGVEPYPMVFDCRSTDPERYRACKRVQRWVVTGLYRAVRFSEYDAGKKARNAADRRQLELAEEP
jgi:hypothetical protein